MLYVEKKAYFRYYRYLQREDKDCKSCRCFNVLCRREMLKSHHDTYQLREMMQAAASK